MKNTFFGLLSFVILPSSYAKAEILRWPQLCSAGKLSIENRSGAVVRAWLQNFTGPHRLESEVILPAHAKVEISVATQLSGDRFSLMHFANPLKISATFSCEKNGLSAQAQSSEGGTLRFNKSDLSENKIWLQNLFSGDNVVRFEFLDAAGKSLGQQLLKLGSFEQFNYKSNPGMNFTQLRVSAENRFTAFSLTSKGAISAQKIEAQKSNLEAEASYFLVAPRDGAGDSFVVRIQNAQMIARARELVAHPELEKIVFAKIEKGHNGFGRNFSKKEKSFWSWSATEVTNFADIGSTACNGIPQLVEDDINTWVQDPGGICFWNYRLKKELSSNEVANPG